LTDGVLLGLCSASAVFSFLPALRLGLINLEGYIAFSLFPHLSAIPRHGLSTAQGTEAARISGRRRLAFQPRSDRAVDDPRTETKLICVAHTRTVIIA
jgi:hypothetical protein